MTVSSIFQHARWKIAEACAGEGGGIQLGGPHRQPARNRSRPVEERLRSARTLRTAAGQPQSTTQSSKLGALRALSVIGAASMPARRNCLTSDQPVN